MPSISPRPTVRSVSRDDDNYFTLSSQQLTQTPARGHAIFIMGIGMSIRHSAWVFGVPSCLKTEYQKRGDRYFLPSITKQTHSGAGQPASLRPISSGQSERIYRFSKGPKLFFAFDASRTAARTVARPRILRATGSQTDKQTGVEKIRLN